MYYQPPYRITTKIVHLLTDIAERLGEIKSINSEMNTPQLRKKNQIKTITGTLQIEGNTFSEEKVTAVLEGKRVLGTPKEIAEVKGAIAVYEKLGQYDCHNIKHLLYAHQVLMGQILTHAGQFRTKAVGVHGKKGVTHIAPQANRLSGLMTDLFNWLKHTEEHPLISSSVFHYEFEFIHPFIDGNGRMGRLWQTLILSKWKPLFQTVPVESTIRDYQQDYYHALKQSGVDGESTAFIEFMLVIILKSIQRPDQVTDHVADQVIDYVPDQANEQITDQIIGQVTIQVKNLLVVIGNNWKSSKELMHKLNLSHKPTFRKNYLNPALEQKLIIMKYPDSPRSPKQRYKKT